MYALYVFFFGGGGLHLVVIVERKTSLVGKGLTISGYIYVTTVASFFVVALCHFIVVSGYTLDDWVLIEKD